MNHLFKRWTLVLACSVVAACSSTPEPKQQQDAAPIVNDAAREDIGIWLLEKEALLRESIAGSPFTLRQQGATWVVTAPAQTTFNPDRPDLLLPAVLGPIARIAKLLEADKDAAVLILGHTAQSKDSRGNQKLSTDRARSVASIFRLSGLTSGRMTNLGMGSSHLLADAKYTEHNHRVEIIVMPSVDVQGVMAVYRPAYVRQLALSQAK